MKKPEIKKKIEIVNRKAKHEYLFIDEYEAGIVLLGTEIKSIRSGLANLNDAYCHFKGDELFVINLFIGEYSHGNINNHETRRDRKLLLRRQELKKLQRKVTEKSMTIFPYKLYISDRGFAKLRIILGKGKKSYDKRQSLKEKDSKRELGRMNKLRDQE